MKVVLTNKVTFDVKIEKVPTETLQKWISNPHFNDDYCPADCDSCPFYDPTYNFDCDTEELHTGSIMRDELLKRVSMRSDQEFSLKGDNVKSLDLITVEIDNSEYANEAFKSITED